ncbi:MAG: TetR/AcrR family transcriptional regulator [Mycolicibacterium cosmeticum]|nr:TetR/AcrR family transcriptional regulator [Mycolicibacterium cosmeticum]
MTTAVPPTGRDEVAAAILEASADLFAQRGPTATSMRDIALRAQVNHGLIHRHFGTKEHLVGAVLDHLGSGLNTLVSDGAPAEAIEAATDRHTRVMARALLDGYPVGQLQTRFPNIALLMDKVLPSYGTNDRAGRMAVANAVALQLGWRMFEPFLRSAVGLDEMTEVEVRAAVGATAARILDPG